MFPSGKRNPHTLISAENTDSLSEPIKCGLFWPFFSKKYVKKRLDRPPVPCYNKYTYAGSFFCACVEDASRRRERSAAKGGKSPHIGQAVPMGFNAPSGFPLPQGGANSYRRCRYARSSNARLHRVQAKELQHNEEQEERSRPSGDEQVLPFLQKAYCPSRDEVKPKERNKLHGR